jgi:hypothetical protein
VRGNELRLEWAIRKGINYFILPGFGFAHPHISPFLCSSIPYPERCPSG